MRWSRLFGFLSLSVASIAQAGGPPESVVQVAVDPTDPNHIVLRYENAGDGLLMTTDGGTTWRSLCTAGVQPATLDRLDSLGRIGMAGDGTLFIGAFDAGIHDDGTGCGWATEPTFDDQWTTDFTNHPSDPDVFFAVNSTARSSGPDAENGVFMRDATGTWSALGSRDVTLIGRLLVVELEGGGLRMYQSGSRGVIVDTDGVTNWANYMIRVSDDMGETWTEHLYDVGEPGTFFYLEAVDPTNPDRILVSHHRQGEQGGRLGIKDEVLISDDQGATLTTYVELTQFGGLDMAADGRVWIADQGDPADLDQSAGLYAAASLDEAPTVVDDTRQITCVRHFPGEDKLLTCSRIEAGFSKADGSDYEATVHFANVEEVVQCDDQDNVATCKPQYTRYWCTPAHFSTASLCCPYVEDGKLVGTPVSETLDCSAWEAMNQPDPAVDAGMTTTGDGDGMVTGDGDGMVTGDGDGMVTGDGDGDSMSMTPDTPMTPVTPTDTEDDGGCGCAVPGSSRGRAPGSLFLLGLLGLGLLRRRRRRRGHPNVSFD